MLFRSEFWPPDSRLSLLAIASESFPSNASSHECASLARSMVLFLFWDNTARSFEFTYLISAFLYYNNSIINQRNIVLIEPSISDFSLSFSRARPSIVVIISRRTIFYPTRTSVGSVGFRAGSWGYFDLFRFAFCLDLDFFFSWSFLTVLASTVS